MLEHKKLAEIKLAYYGNCAIYSNVIQEVTETANEKLPISVGNVCQ